VFHQAFIAVDEEGTEAAAATAIGDGVTGMPVVEVTLAIDHPFLFLIRDRETGLVLFMGKVVTR
jgi:serpin B